MTRNESLVTVKKVCHQALKNIPGGRKIKDGLAMYYWPKVIGPDLAKKTEAVKISNGRLWVKTPDPTLTQNLTFFSKQIIDKYVSLMGPGIVRSVRITTGAITIQQAPDLKKEQEKNLRDEELQIPPEINTIEDEDLKKVFSRLYRRHFLLKKTVKE